MSKYFNFFPNTLYTVDTITGDAVKNITARFSFEKSVMNMIYKIVIRRKLLLQNFMAIQKDIGLF